MRLFIFGSSATVVVAAVACSAFSSSLNQDSSIDASVETAPSRGDGDTTKGADAQTPDLGCPDATITADFVVSPLRSPFTRGSTSTSFESLIEDGGPFGRFTIEGPEAGADASIIPDSQEYRLEIAQSAQHLCCSTANASGRVADVDRGRRAPHDRRHILQSDQWRFRGWRDEVGGREPLCFLHLVDRERGRTA